MPEEFINSKNALYELLVNKEYNWDQVIVGFSGGKDSTATLQLLIDVCVENDITNIPIKVLSSNTLIENPLIERQLLEVSEQIETIGRENNIDLQHIILEPNINDSFFVNTIGKGYSTPLSTMGRWCTRALKVDPMERYYKNINVRTLVLSGVRESESTLRKKNIKSYFKEELQKDSECVYKFAPIKDWKLNHVWDYIMAFWRSDESHYINNNTLWEIYRDGTSDDVCPSSLDMSMSREKTSSCGKSRYGCYMCPLIKKDKALEANVQNGREELRPYLDLRNWYMERSFDPEYRMRQNRRGTVKLKEIKFDEETRDYEFKLLYTQYKGNLNDNNVLVLPMENTMEDLKEKVIENTEEIQLENRILLFMEVKDGHRIYKTPTTGKLSDRFRVGLYNKIIEIEAEHNISILKEEESQLIEIYLTEDNINFTPRENRD